MMSRSFVHKLLRLHAPLWVVLGVCTIAAPVRSESLSDRICNPPPQDISSTPMFSKPSTAVDLPKYLSFDRQRSESKPITAFEFYTQATDFYPGQTADKKISLLNKAIALAPNYTAAYRNRAMLYARSKMYALAIADYDRLRHLEPANEINFLKNKAYLYSLSRQWEKLIRVYDKLLVMQPNNARFIHLIKARAHSELKDWDSAITEYSQAIALSKNTRTYPRDESPGYSPKPIFSKQSLEPNPSLTYVSSSKSLFFGFDPEPPSDLDYSLGIFMGNESGYQPKAGSHSK